MAKQVRSLKSHYARSFILAVGAGAIARYSKMQTNPKIKANMQKGANILGVGAIVAMLVAHGNLIYRASKYQGGDK